MDKRLIQIFNFIDNLNTPIAFFDLNHNLDHCNASFSLALPNTRLKGCQISEIFHFYPNSKESFKESFSVVNTFQTEAFIKVTENPNELLVTTLKVIPIADISDHYLVEILPKSEIIKDELNLRSIGQKLSNATHRLSNPISVIQLNIDLIMSSISNENINQKNSSRLKKIKISTDQVVQDLNKIKIFARLLTELNIESIKTQLEKE